MARGVLFTGGLAPSADKVKAILREGDIICAADSGLDTALANAVHPAAVVGDMDSLSDRKLLHLFPKNSLRVFQEEKDFSDTELGLNWLREQHCHPIVIIGGGEGRLDHTLALVKIFEKEHPPNQWYSAQEEINLIQSKQEDLPLKVKGKAGSLISFFPIGKEPWRIRSQGLRWELDTLDWREGALSLSNVFLQDEIQLYPYSGRFLMIQPLIRSHCVSHY